MDTIHCFLSAHLFLITGLGAAGPILTIVFLLACSALISSSEVAMFSLTPVQRTDLQHSKNTADRHILDLLELPDKETGPKRLLATILIANNAINIAIVLLAQDLVTMFFPAGDYATWVKTLIDVVAITFVIVLFGEVIPKVYATGNNLKVARLMALPLKIVQWLLKPVTWMLMKTSGLLEERLKESSRGNISVDELGHALELTADDDRTAEEHKILEGIVTFGAKEAGQIMTPRTDIVFLHHDYTFIEVMEVVMNKGYSRLPVIKSSPDDILGFLFIKDLLAISDATDYDWLTLVKQPFFVPENKKIDDLLQQFQQTKTHLAIVVDEYGGTSGLVTLEDILEEIVGEISDEFDEDELQYSKLDERNYVIEAKIALVDMYRLLDIDGESFEEYRGDSSTLGGFLLEQHGSIPQRGDVINFQDFVFFIEAADKRRIKRVKITLPEQITNNN